MRVVASVIESILLLSFADLGCFEGESSVVDKEEILFRKPGGRLSSRNNDGVSHALLSPVEIPDVFEKRWVEDMQDIIVSWAERVSKSCLS